VIAEDDYFLRSTPGALPGNAHIISTATLLAKLEELGVWMGRMSMLSSVAGQAASMVSASTASYSLWVPTDFT